LYISTDKHDFELTFGIWQCVNFLPCSENGGSSKCPLDSSPIKPEEVRWYNLFQKVCICTYHERSL